MNTFNHPQSDASFAIWSERAVIADCLRELNLPLLAQKAIDFNTSQELISEFLNIIKAEANALKRHDVLESLYFSSLIYG